MPVSSRTPEGSPHRCRLCGATAAVETSEPSGDSICPACGSLLWKIRDRISEESLVTLTDEPSLDSLEMVELVMECEEEFELQIPVEDRDKFESIDDLIRYLRRRLGEDPPG